MIKKIVAYILITFGLTALWASTSRSAMAYLYKKRVAGTWWGVYPEDHGDLVSLSYLDFVNAFKHNAGSPLTKRPYDGPANMVLYLDGDSYTWQLGPALLNGLSAYHYISRYEPSHYTLDTTKRNILVIEIAERMLRQYFDSVRMIYDLSDANNGNHAADRPVPVYTSNDGPSPSLAAFGLFNNNINQNLQFNLFNYRWIMPLFESKAALNYYIFKRASGRVEISDDGTFLFLKETVSNTGLLSSYSRLAPSDINILVNNLNFIYGHFKASGFEEIYLSIIPNSATIVQPQKYNNLIPLVQNDPGLKMKVIDVYSVFRASGQQLYLAGDTHWNNAGMQLYIDLLNQVIEMRNNIGDSAGH